MNFNYGYNNNCFGNYGNWRSPFYCPSNTEHVANFSDQRVDTGFGFRGFGGFGFGGFGFGGLGCFGGMFGRTSSPGTVIDLNRNGRYDKRQDGVLAFDWNKDGKISKQEIAQSNAAIKGLKTGRYNCWTRRLIQLDKNGDGRFSTHELSRGGAKIWVDRDGDGRRDCGELRSVYDVRGNGSGQRLQLDGFGNTSIRHTRRFNPWNPGPWNPTPWQHHRPYFFC